ncbi:ArsR family transcriptional regulator [Haloferax elongans ATCC BAA-1513]|uniref:ArsR family transcriptional regulator n=1 Tax=Haloferax elongans ATCC BAA-1513 TaxID=1230453 RepID=M0HNH3_HALEO|nr:MarR family transcriptional regulator [Haloferax elongans]ELZ84654.1 ArsR family transcriptional regulator [Haloferax elongans ATCC BAA-1513]
MSHPQGESYDREQTDYWTDEEFRERISDLPPSAKLVARILDNNDQMTQEQLMSESLLLRRTVGYALNRLEENGLVHSRPDLRDPRKRLYELAMDT